MELRVLGAHNMESKETRMEFHLIDGVLALDAGGLTRALSFEEQQGIRAIILSHRHFDHVRDLLPLGLATRDCGITTDVYAIQDTVEFVTAKLLDGSLYPDFLNHPSPENPVLRLHTIEFYREFKLLDYTAVAVPVAHSVPARQGFKSRRVMSGSFTPGMRVGAWTAPGDTWLQTYWSPRSRSATLTKREPTKPVTLRQLC